MAAEKLKERLKNVPQDQVPDKVRQFMDFDGKTKVVCTKNRSGTWDIEAS